MSPSVFIIGPGFIGEEILDLLVEEAGSMSVCFVASIKRAKIG
jgi:hypothetical protein